MVEPGLPDGEQLAEAAQVQHEQRESAERREFPVLAARVRSAEEFGRAVGTYQSNLNKAVENNHIAAIREPLINLARNSQRNGEADSVAADDRPDAEQNTRDVDQVYRWFQDNYGGATTLIEQYLPKTEGTDSQAARTAVRERLATDLAQWYFSEDGLRKPEREAMRNRALSQTAQFLLEKSDHFTPVKEILDERGLQIEPDGPNWDRNAKLLEGAVIIAKVEEELAELSGEDRDEALRSWLIDTSHEARKGRELPDGSWEKRKIYETPYYQSILTELGFRGKKVNGVGGVILYGPPGTGKTELIREKNRREGYKTRVVNVHKYSTFADLLAERQLSVNVDKSASLVDKLGTITEQFGHVDGDQFKAAITEAFAEMKRQKHIDDTATLIEFLRPMVALSTDGVTQELLANPDQNWDLIRKAFIAKQQARMALVAGGHPDTDPVVEDIVRGELLLAIKESEGTGDKYRVLLDELDKAGGGSFGGLLTFIALSPGESMKFGNTTVDIPPWFKVDATSNNSGLDAYLRSRFGELTIDTPPPKDQLMIATTRMIDREGVVQLSDHEQEQVAAYFMYVVPRINALMQGVEGAEPLSNRDIQLLTSLLVDYDDRKRTDLSVEGALRKTVMENSKGVKDVDLHKNIAGVLDAFEKMMADEPPDIEELFPQVSAGEAQPVGNDVSNQPLLRIINGLRSGAMEDDSEKIPSVKVLEIDTRHQEQIRAHLEQQSQVHRSKIRNALVLPTGLELEEKDGILRLQAIPAEDDGRETHTLHSVHARGEVTMASADGSVVAMGNHTEQGTFYSIVKPFDNEKAKETPLFHVGKVDMNATGTQIVATAAHKGFAILDVGSEKPGFQTISLGETDNPAVEDFQLAPDGKSVLVVDANNNTWLVSTEKRRSLVKKPLSKPPEGHIWQFVGDNIVVQAARDGSAVGTKALYVA